MAPAETADARIGDRNAREDSDEGRRKCSAISSLLWLVFCSFFVGGLRCFAQGLTVSITASFWMKAALCSGAFERNTALLLLDLDFRKFLKLRSLTFFYFCLCHFNFLRLR